MAVMYLCLNCQKGMILRSLMTAVLMIFETTVETNTSNVLFDFKIGATFLRIVTVGWNVWGGVCAGPHVQRRAQVPVPGPRLAMRTRPHLQPNALQHNHKYINLTGKAVPKSKNNNIKYIVCFKNGLIFWKAAYNLLANNALKMC